MLLAVLRRLCRRCERCGGALAPAPVVRLCQVCADVEETAAIASMDALESEREGREL